MKLKVMRAIHVTTWKKLKKLRTAKKSGASFIGNIISTNISKYVYKVAT